MEFFDVIMKQDEHFYLYATSPNHNYIFQYHKIDFHIDEIYL